MELLLNIVWFAIASVALGELARRTRLNREQYLLALFALGCALLLLFPVVSISDDIHLQTFVSEDSFATKRMATIGADAGPVPPLFWFGISVLATLFLGLRRSIWFRHEQPLLSYASPLLQQLSLGRVPPTSLLG